MPTLRTVTLGCKVNQYETEYVREGLLRLGYEEAADGQPADLCVVNTCTVTAEGDLKSRKLIRQLARQNPNAEIVVMGCYATRAPEAVRRLPGVTQVVTDKRQLPELLGRFGLADVPTGICSFGHRHRAYVKVQDGCRMNCAYCIVPQVRPVLVSRPVSDALDEVRRLVDNGYREIVLTGIHLGHYGMAPTAAASEQEHVGLAALLRRIVELEGEFRVRLSSLEAAEITEELIAVMVEHTGRICPHLHLAVQSGSDAVLARMQRRGSARQILERCESIRRRIDEPAFTTDMMVGFPGESEEDFRQTCRLAEQIGFSKIHVFRFSPRKGTPAADMPDQVPEMEKHRRARELADLARRLRQEYFRRLVGRTMQVLVESPLGNQPGRLLGISERYAPVELTGSAEMLGKLVQVTATRVAGGRIQAGCNTDTQGGREYYTTRGRIARL